MRGIFARLWASLFSARIEPEPAVPEPLAPEHSWPVTHDDEPGAPEPIADEPTPIAEPVSWLEELQAQLDAAGVTRFTAKELTWLPKAKPPKHDEPPRELWPDLIKVAEVAQAIRELYGEPLWVSTAWRPPWYNQAVGGSKGSAHQFAAAADLNVMPGDRTPERTKRLEQAGATVWRNDNRARGFGVYRGSRIHIDVYGRKRSWGEASRVLKELGE